jgi:simple sugar transport system ATP-binding protein
VSGAALELRGIFKRFGPVEALRGVDFTLEQGEIHALLGENGAGKSTLMKVAYGLLRPDAGSVSVFGSDRRMHSAAAARSLGIGMVHQHFTSVPAFTVLESIALAAAVGPRADRLRPRLVALMERTGLELDPNARVETLSAGLKQRLEVLKALATNARLLLLDEPSSVLPPPEAEALLDLVKRLRSQGVSSVLITHKLSEALQAADRVTVLRRGAVVHVGSVAGETPAHLATLMLGEAPEPMAARPVARVRVESPSRIRATGLALPRLGGTGSGLQSATLEVRSGELVGLAAVEGNGQRELLRILAGVARPRAGTLEVAQPVAFIPEDRTTEALVASFSLTENLVLAQGGAALWAVGPWLNWRKAAARTAELIAQYGVRGADPGTPAGKLSGGNQQRLIIASALERHPAVVIAENPTRGLDIRATSEIHGRLRHLASLGVAVLVHLPDLDELMELTDRIVVLASGVLQEMPPQASRDEIGRALLGVLQ